MTGCRCGHLDIQHINGRGPCSVRHQQNFWPALLDVDEARCDCGHQADSAALAQHADGTYCGCTRYEEDHD